MRRPRWLRLLLAVDQLFNVALLNGDEDETISSNAGKRARDGIGWACVLCRFLDLLDPNHCEKSVEFDEGRRIESVLADVSVDTTDERARLAAQ